jgi:hypothetical protein
MTCIIITAKGSSLSGVGGDLAWKCREDSPSCKFSLEQDFDRLSMISVDSYGRIA